ncbi:MAG TPA: molybdenum cofactor biosynthesis protein MoaE [Nitrososphaera sp.]|nr:molybdenum cofactor biosynthesis protein MoaE [Nitrososphaera sp.]
MFSISEDPIDVEGLLANVKDDSAGATILFLGTIRNHNEGYDVSAIYYEVYMRMAEEAMAKIEAEAIRRWNLKKFAAIHRIGNLKIGEVSVAIAVSSEHRAEAFEAARYAIDQIKSEVPIWKKEIINNGKEAKWAQGTPMGGG